MVKKAAATGPTWPADKVERRPTASLVPYARNSNVHSPQSVSKLAGLIKEFGWTNPVLIRSDGTIIAGHGRVMAAQQLGLDTVPVMVADGWSEEKARAFVLADNRSARDATTDPELLMLELSELDEAGFDLALTGYEADELAKLLAMPADGFDEDEGEGDGEGDGDKADVGVTVGPYRFTVARDDFLAWQQALRDKVGFEPDAARDAIAQRLGVARA